MNKLAPRFSPLLAVTVVSLAAACGGNVVVDHGSSQGTGGAGASGGNHSTSTLSAMGGSTSDVSPVGTGPGNVTVGPGSGGSNTTTTATQVGPGPGPGVSASTGPQQCDCNVFCNDLVPCVMGQISQAQCLMFCQSNQLPPGLQTCVCNVGADCGAIFQQCANMGTGPGPGSAVSVGPGPGSAVSVGPGVGPGPGATSSVGVGGGGTGGGLPMGCSDCANMAIGGPCAMQAQACHQSCQNVLQCEENCNFDPTCVAGCKMGHPNGAAELDALLVCAVCENCSSECANTDLFTSACTLPP